MPAMVITGKGSQMSLCLENIKDGETVYQRCIIIKGTCSKANPGDVFVSIETQDEQGQKLFPAQTWPVVDSRFKIIAMLTPGSNVLKIQPGFNSNDDPFELRVNYLPLLQTPPLHLAILIAKDSPLLIDCPPVKYGAFSSAHSSLDAAIAKFRMTAYMWQALTAEDMRMKGLGRRAFRLEEEWTADSTSRDFVLGQHEAALHSSGAMRSTAKIHLIKSEKTVSEIRNLEVAQQNNSARNANALHEYFSQALKAHGIPFESSAHPIVAGLILDSHYSMGQNLIVGHAALGAHNSKGLSLGIFGSHLTYSWPRFVEEITSSLVDTRSPGDTVGNDCNECGTLWEACSIGQGAFLHEVGHAFGAPHTTGIMSRGYAQHWPRPFIVQTAFCQKLNQDGFVVVDGETKNEACWDIKDALSFKHLAHFWIPGDTFISPQDRALAPHVSVPAVDDENKATLSIRSATKIGEILFNGDKESVATISKPVDFIEYKATTLYSRFSREEPLSLHVLAMNGKTRVIKNIWRLFDKKSHIRVDANLVLQKRSVCCKDLEENEDEELHGSKLWTWATLLTRRKEDGTIEKATKVDVRTGCILDGAYVHFGKDDQDRINCGPRIQSWGGGYAKSFGGHASEAIDIPADQYIVRVEVSRDQDILRGLRMHLGNGEAKGALSGGDDVPETSVLESSAGEHIVGFYGRSYFGSHFDGLVEFGILTAPEGVELPANAYAMEELQNTDGGINLEEFRRENGYTNDESGPEDEDEQVSDED